MKKPTPNSPKPKPNRILPDRLYKDVPIERVRWIESHLRQSLKIKVLGKRYVERMSMCRPGRRCNFFACPQCWLHQERLRMDQVRAALIDHPLEAVLTIDVLLEPRDRLSDADHSPKKDMAKLRAIFRKKFVRNPAIESFFMFGRYEVEAKRAEETEFLRQNRKGNRKSRAVVPHLHAVAIAKNDKGYLSAEKFRAMVHAHFPGERQLKVGYLHRDRKLTESLTNRVGYMFKAKTASLNGKLLRQFIALQLDTRIDAWTMLYRKNPHAIA